jgi:L-ascorbate metabolism protein UlaG (beta-lactamase superfamily)
MIITKFGHCCLLVEVDGVRILTDPGNYNETPMATGVDVVLITHEHQDHCHVESLQIVLAKNPDARVISHVGVGKILDTAGIKWEAITDGEAIQVKQVRIQSFGTEHACIHHDLPLVQNTGFLIAGRLFYPGDSFHNPGKMVEILALPVAGPWMKLEEAIEYAKVLKPKAVFPVHDGMLRQEHQLGPTRRIPKALLEPFGIEYVDMTEGTAHDF